jgi:hypothetical protein
MIGTSLVVQEEVPEQYTLSSLPIFNKEAELGLDLAELELHVTDMESGRPIPGAMISIDSIGITAVCGDHGKVVVKNISAERLLIDVIVCGYIASSNMVYPSSREFNTVHIRMVRNC